MGTSGLKSGVPIPTGAGVAAFGVDVDRPVGWVLAALNRRQYRLSWTYHGA